MAGIASFIVPGWYREARSRGESEEELKRRIADFCREAARKYGAPETEFTPEAIAVTYDMYEYALSKDGK